MHRTIHDFTDGFDGDPAALLDAANDYAEIEDSICEPESDLQDEFADPGPDFAPPLPRRRRAANRDRRPSGNRVR